MQNVNQRWDYQLPPDHRMAERNLSLAIHPCAIFQERMWYSKEKKKPWHPKAKPSYPH